MALISLLKENSSIESFKDKTFKEDKIGFHVTSKSKLKSILKKGLVPKVPADMEDEKAVFLFGDYASMDDALFNWFGERIEEWEEETEKEFKETLLVVDLSTIDESFISQPVDSNGDEWFEVICKTVIAPENIIHIEPLY